MRVQRLMTPVLVTLVLLVQGCAADASLVTFAYNAFRPSGSDCLPDGNIYLPSGLLDVAADASRNGVTGPSGANFTADLVMYSEETAVAANPVLSPSFPNYGYVDSQTFMIEEVEIRYNFDYSPVAPADVTLAEIPASIVVPASSVIHPSLSANGPGNSTFVSVELVPRAVSEALRNDSELLALSLLGDGQSNPSTYRMVARFRVRGQHSKGGRFETKDYSYPLELCENCSSSIDPPNNDCYPPWQNQF